MLRLINPFFFNAILLVVGCSGSTEDDKSLENNQSKHTFSYSLEEGDVVTDFVFDLPANYAEVTSLEMREKLLTYCRTCVNVSHIFVDTTSYLEAFDLIIVKYNDDEYNDFVEFVEHKEFSVVPKEIIDMINDYKAQVYNIDGCKILSFRNDKNVYMIGACNKLPYTYVFTFYSLNDNPQDTIKYREIIRSIRMVQN